MNKNFEPGKTYFCRSICDYDCKWSYLVTKRTDKSIYVQKDGTGPVMARRVSSDRYGEFCYPMGHYSMAPVLRADWCE